MKLAEVEQKYKLINKLILNDPEKKIEYIDLFVNLLHNVEP